MRILEVTQHMNDLFTHQRAVVCGLIATHAQDDVSQSPTMSAKNEDLGF